MNLNELYTQIITENSRSKENRHPVEGATHSLEGVNPSCGDDIWLKLKVENDEIVDGAFVGDGCAISQASASLMIDLVKGRTVEDAHRLISLYFQMIKGKITPEELDDLEPLRALIGAAVVDEPPFSVREGELIRDGFHPEVDRLRGILHGGKGLMTSMEAQEKEKTGIRTLKIGYNKVFGYYIEVSNSFKDQVPDTYIRKQTLVNGERYITQELKNLESDILTASDRVSALEYELFTDLRTELAG